MKQLDLYPDFPGFKDTDTSKAAAATLRAGCLKYLRLCDEWGLTADQCATALGKSILAIRPRFTELKRLGKIEDTGQRRRNASGKSAIVWRAKP